MARARRYTQFRPSHPRSAATDPFQPVDLHKWTISEWIQEWLDTGADGIIDVLAAGPGQTNAPTTMLFATRLEGSAQEVLETFSNAIASLIKNGFLSNDLRAASILMEKLAPLSNTGRNATNPPTEGGIWGFVNGNGDWVMPSERDN